MDGSPEQYERRRLMSEILSFRETYALLRAGTFDHWLHIDLTLILVYSSETGSLRMGQLASALGVALSTATGTVDRLVEQGLLTRHEDPEDRRSVVVSLTERGRDTIERPHLTNLTRTAAVLERLSTEDLRTVARALAAVREALQAVLGEADSARPTPAERSFGTGVEAVGN